MLKKIPSKKREKRDAIINGATKLFQELGYRKTSMNKIAKELNMGKSSLYYYFKSKTEIYNAIILYEAIIYRKKVLDSISKNKSPFEKLKSYILIRMQTNKILYNFHRAVTDPTLLDLDFIKRLNKLYDKEEFHLFRNILESGIREGYLEIRDIKNAAIGIVTAMRGIESTIMLSQGDPKNEKKIDNILQIILYGIVKREKV